MKITSISRIFVFSFAVTGFLHLSGNCFAQQKSEDPGKKQKTITIHVTKEVDGNVIVIDTTIVTNDDFDTDAFLKEKGVMDDMPGQKEQMEKEIIIRHPGAKNIEWNESDKYTPDTLVVGDKKVRVFVDTDEIESPDFRHQPGMRYHYYQSDRNHGSPHMQDEEIQRLIEDLTESLGSDNTMSFGDAKQVIIKKKHHGKTIIINFEDNDKDSHKHKGKKNEEKVMIMRNGEQGSVSSPKQKYIIMEGSPEGKMIINEDVDKATNEKTVTVTVGSDKDAPVKQHKKVIIIKEEKEK